MNCLQESRPELEPESRLTSKLAGFKNRLLKPTARPQPGLEEPYRASPGATPSYGPNPGGPSPSPLDSAYDFGALAEEGRDAGQGASTASRPNSGRNNIMWYQPGSVQC